MSPCFGIVNTQGKGIHSYERGLKMNRLDEAEKKLAEAAKIMKLFDEAAEKGDKAKAREYLLQAHKIRKEAMKIVEEDTAKNMEELERLIENSRQP